MMCVTYVCTSRAARISSSRSILADEYIALARVSLAYQKINIELELVHKLALMQLTFCPPLMKYGIKRLPNRDINRWLTLTLVLVRQLLSDRQHQRAPGHVPEHTDG